MANICVFASPEQIRNEKTKSVAAASSQENRILPAYVHLLKQRTVRPFAPKLFETLPMVLHSRFKRPFSDLPPPKDRLGASVHPTATLLHLSWSGSFRLWGRCTWRTLLQTAATSEIGTFVLWKVQFSGVLASLSRTLDKMEPISFKCQGKS